MIAALVAFPEGRRCSTQEGPQRGKNSVWGILRLKVVAGSRPSMHSVAPTAPDVHWRRTVVYSVGLGPKDHDRTGKLAPRFPIGAIKGVVFGHGSAIVLADRMPDVGITEGGPVCRERSLFDKVAADDPGSGSWQNTFHRRTARDRSQTTWSITSEWTQRDR